MVTGFRSFALIYIAFDGSTAASQKSASLLRSGHSVRPDGTAGYPPLGDLPGGLRDWLGWVQAV